MDNLQLNLARKWRSKTFDEVIGQELVIRLLKNSLYRSSLLSVYLLSGMRGCGKTSVGRLFACALNCSQLELFRQQPQQIILPCNNCNSCNLMKKGQHPDFIEIDAASHTGVDNIRNLIDMASFVPIVGSKKIYLIDEAHMLSKAAFNALLKILEEPPMSVIFMLATTDAHKIIDTVKSRCFQLFFNPIEKQTLINHLNYICKQEDIVCEQDALSLIAEQSEGSVRDALNLIERVRLTNSKIDKQAVIQILGFLDEERLINLFEAVFIKEPYEILSIFSSYNLETYNTTLLWKKFIDLLRSSLLIKQRLKTDEFEIFQERIEKIVDKIPFNTLVSGLEIFYNNEFLFTKTASAHTLFQLVLIKINRLTSSLHELHNTVSGHGHKQNEINSTKREKKSSDNMVDIRNESKEKAVNEHDVTVESNSRAKVENEDWQKFLKLVDTIEDNLVNSIFKQARFVAFESENKTIEIAFAQNLTFFKELIEDTKVVWQKLLEKTFGLDVLCKISFIDPSASLSRVYPTANENSLDKTQNSKELGKTNINSDNVQVGKPEFRKNTGMLNSDYNNVKKNFKTEEPSKNLAKQVSFSISDSENWPKATMLLKKFPGNLTSSK